MTQDEEKRKEGEKRLRILVRERAAFLKLFGEHLSIVENDWGKCPAFMSSSGWQKAISTQPTGVGECVVTTRWLLSGGDSKDLDQSSLTGFPYNSWRGSLSSKSTARIPFSLILLGKT